jgi:FdhE protein
MTVETEETTAGKRWERLAADHPELAPAISFQRRAWALLRGARATAALPDAGAEEAQARFASGVPLLVAARPTFARDPPFSLLAELAGLTWHAFGEDGARRLERAARSRHPAAAAGLAAALRRDPGGMAAAAEELGVPGESFSALCELAVSPSLRALADAALPVSGGSAWTRGYCPLCASWPIFAETRDGGQGRYLRCGLCGSDWSFARLDCPFCGESDHRRLRAIHVEGEAAYRRVDVCDACKGYVKSLARLSPTPPALLPIEDLATAYLDLLALEAGYGKPGVPPAFAAPAREG